VHTCLADVLERGTAEKVFTEHGLKRFPLGGKTGTAYNFTDLWFVGYSSEVTCSVWAGFDKPRTTIYRGAFSNEVALPIWANVMKATFASYRPREITAPKGIIKCELCAASGLLATDKCTAPAENGAAPPSTTYFEIATDAQAPKEGCTVHSNVPSPVVNTMPGGEPPRAGKEQWPRPTLAANPALNAPVALKAPTVIGDDPYNSTQSLSMMTAQKAMQGKVAPLDSSRELPTAVPAAPEPDVEVRRAERVRPMEEQQAVGVDSPIKIEQPPALEF
jgi:penicillin-binding protein 1A